MSFVFQPFSLEETTYMSIFTQQNAAGSQQRRYDRLCTFPVPASEPSMGAIQVPGSCEARSGFQKAEGFPNAESQVGSQPRSLAEVQASDSGNNSHHLG